MHHRTPGIGGTLLASLLVGAAHAGTGTALLRVDDGPYQPVPLVVALQLDGTVSYVGEITSANGDWKVEVNLAVDQSAVQNGSIVGTTRFRNLGSRTIGFELDFDVPLCPQIDTASLMGASLQVQLQAGGDGAVLSLPAGDDLFQGRVDGDSAHALFEGPFFMTASGSGLMSSSTSFGLPLPSSPGPEVLGSIGTRHRLHLTGGDVATFNCTYVVGPSDGATDECYDEYSCDLDGDGAIGFGDLTVMLAEWGPCGGCDADVNDSGVVDVVDLLVLLSYWGA